MNFKALENGEHQKILLIIPQQDRVEEARGILDKEGILHIVYSSSMWKTKGIVVDAIDVKSAQYALQKANLGVLDSEGDENTVLKLKPVIGFKDINKVAAHVLTCRNIPCWVQGDYSICVKKGDETEARHYLGKITFLVD